MFTYSYEWEEIVVVLLISATTPTTTKGADSPPNATTQAAVFDSDELTDGLNIPLDLRDSGKNLTEICLCSMTGVHHEMAFGYPFVPATISCCDWHITIPTAT